MIITNGDILAYATKRLLREQYFLSIPRIIKIPISHETGPFRWTVPLHRRMAILCSCLWRRIWRGRRRITEISITARFVHGKRGAYSHD